MPGDLGLRCSECGSETRYRELYKQGRFGLNHQEGCSQAAETGFPKSTYVVNILQPQVKTPLTASVPCSNFECDELVEVPENYNSWAFCSRECQVVTRGHLDGL